ncbi:His Kinase A (phospho-acceptor) domain-containing protein [Actinoplanes philippinensis]|uniref:histidine kinase n=2 Tax=Actinoplanes philippinensis TaxID=35752 RepID=A0A1I2HMR9_9ACTN|nr:His Kinase A (phospho-acceptor) domain-containing protein [Actinoplanes philippinensis]
MLVVDPELHIVEATDAYLTATGTTREALVGRPIFAAFPDNPDDPDASGVAVLGASLDRVRTEHVTDVMAIQRYDIPEPGGGFEARWWAPLNAPVLGPDGRLRWIVHRVEDVTPWVHAGQEGDERIQAEMFARLRLEERRQVLEAVVDSLDVAVIGSDAGGLPVLYNDAARALIGDRIAEMPADQWGQRLHLRHPDGSPIGGDLPLLRALRGERVRDAEVVRRAPGRAQRVFRVHSRPVDGSEVAAVVAIHEITRSRRAARLRECELAVAKAMAAGGPGERVLSEAVELIGTTIGFTVAEFWTCDDIVGQPQLTARWADPAATTPDGSPDRELPARAWRDGATTTEPAALAVPLPSGSHVLGVLVCRTDGDIPDDVRTGLAAGVAPSVGAYLERRRAERLAAELDRAHDQYIALAGHELRTPLTSIQSYTDLLLDEPGLTDDQRHMLTVIERNAAGLRAVVLKLLDVAALRSGRLDMIVQRADLAVIVREAAGRGDRPIRVDAPATAPVDGDPVRLRQVVDELLDNARAWAEDGSPVRVRLSAGSPGTALSVSVSNVGPAVRDDERDRLFDLFYRGTDARRRGVPGAGLGLSLARAVVEQHGGTLTLDDTAAGTTTFTVRLPAVSL